jgi:hypothetical protein
MKTIFVLIFSIYSPDTGLIMTYDPPYYSTVDSCGKAGMKLSERLMNEGVDMKSLHFVCIETVPHEGGTAHEEDKSDEGEKY